jgi:hypothetical protein
MSTAELVILGLERGVDFVELDRIDMGQVWAIAEDRPLRVGDRDPAARLVVFDRVPEAAAGLSLQQRVAEVTPHHGARPLFELAATASAVLADRHTLLVEPVGDGRTIQ